ncbi:MAG: hypothetical protein WAM14_10085 [Candidatus Nitrosopolaris sp.]
MMETFAVLRRPLEYAKESLPGLSVRIWGYPDKDLINFPDLGSPVFYPVNNVGMFTAKTGYVIPLEVIVRY